MLLFCLRKKYADIPKKMCNIIDIKLNFWYTCLLNHMMIGDQFMNLYIQVFYPTIGPVKAFYFWWSVFVFENLGDYKF